MAVSVYAICKLRQFNRITRHVLNVDYRILDYEKKLTDSVLSQLRYEKKYNITKDIVFYNQFPSAKEDFEKHLRDTALIADISDPN